MRIWNRASILVGMAISVLLGLAAASAALAYYNQVGISVSGSYGYGYSDDAWYGTGAANGTVQTSGPGAYRRLNAAYIFYNDGSTGYLGDSGWQGYDLIFAGGTAYKATSWHQLMTAGNVQSSAVYTNSN